MTAASGLALIRLRFPLGNKGNGNFPSGSPPKLRCPPTDNGLLTSRRNCHLSACQRAKRRALTATEVNTCPQGKYRTIQKDFWHSLKSLFLSREGRIQRELHLRRLLAFA